MIKVAIGIIVNTDNHILTALRPLHAAHGGLWEFPGGKFEQNETAFQALQRELSEEIGVSVIKAKLITRATHHYPPPSSSVELHAFHITHYSGVPTGCEGQEIRWVNYSDLLHLTFPEANKPIIQQMSKWF